MGVAKTLSRPVDMLAGLGQELRFYLSALAWIPGAIKRYPRDILRLLSEVSFGSAPLVAALAMSATVGSGFTAQLGAMRISEEIDALDVMAVPSIPYLVSTRIIAGFIAIIPLYVIGLLSSYLASRTITVYFYGQSAGTYDHYFNLFLPPQDVFWSFGKVLIFSVAIILVHCYYGYRA